MQNSFENILKSWFEKCPFAVIAFSGGVDSSLVAYLANLFLGQSKTLAVISASPSLKLSDLEEGRQFCKEWSIPLKIIETEELKNPSYFSNPVNRCYFCKKTLYGDLSKIIDGSWILNGTNLDDMSDHRPGLLAAKEYEIKSPLLDCGLRKEDVRELAKFYCLSVWDKPASPCMSSRIPYGEMVTLEKLRQIERGEEILREAGFTVSRLRHYGCRAVIEVPTKSLPNLREKGSLLIEELRALGFKEVLIDEDGFQSGKLNRELRSSEAV